MSKLAWELTQTDEYDEAIELHKRIIEITHSSDQFDDEDEMSARYRLAGCLSQMGRHKEAIEERRIELTWCRDKEGTGSLGTITSINSLAEDLRDIGELKEAEALFREVVEVRKQVPKPDDFQIGRALGGLARTLEEIGNLEESLINSQQALEHRNTLEGCDAWWTNHERLGLSRVLHKLGRSAEALSLLDQLQESMAKLKEPEEDDQQLLDEAKELHQTIISDGLRS